MESPPPANQRPRISPASPGGCNTSLSPGSVAAFAGRWRVRSGEESEAMGTTRFAC